MWLTAVYLKRPGKNQSFLKTILKKHIKGVYGQWHLVQLLSGKWSPVWWAALDIEDLFLAIVMEDENWFSHQITFAPPSVHATKAEALREIIHATEKEMEEHPSMRPYFELNLKRAQMALIRAVK
jgi:hypothetical protein